MNPFLVIAGSVISLTGLWALVDVVQQDRRAARAANGMTLEDDIQFREYAQD